MAIGDKTHKHNTLNLNGCNISCDEEVKLLGVTIDFKLTLQIHVKKLQSIKCFKKDRTTSEQTCKNDYISLLYYVKPELLPFDLALLQCTKHQQNKNCMKEHCVSSTMTTPAHMTHCLNNQNYHH
jgi:hypothetical protein